VECRGSSPAEIWNDCQRRQSFGSKKPAKDVSRLAAKKIVNVDPRLAFHTLDGHASNRGGCRPKKLKKMTRLRAINPTSKGSI
jgi:hypothetical protein